MGAQIGFYSTQSDCVTFWVLDFRHLETVGGGGAFTAPRVFCAIHLSSGFLVKSAEKGNLKGSSLFYAVLAETNRVCTLGLHLWVGYCSVMQCRLLDSLVWG
jgi:hypothetical protein